MTESYFAKVANDVLEATEQIATRMEEGLTAIMKGETPKQEDHYDQPILDGMDEEDGEDWLTIEEELRRSSPLEGIAESVMGNIMAGQAKPQTAGAHIEAFRHAITWSEPFILFLIAFQCVIFGLSLWVSKRDRGLAPRLILMSVIAGTVRSSELLNSYAAQNWGKFCTQNYFDDRGIFVMIMVCAPLLLDSLIMLILFMKEAAQLLVQVKSAELKKKHGSTKSGSSPTSKKRLKKDQ